MLETLDYTIRIGSIPTFLYFDLHLFNIMFMFPPRHTKTTTFVILLCLTILMPDNFTRQKRSSGWERVNIMFMLKGTQLQIVVSQNIKFIKMNSVSEVTIIVYFVYFKYWIHFNKFYVFTWFKSLSGMHSCQ